MNPPAILRSTNPSKYRAKSVVVGGLFFPSQKEARRWAELQLMERAGLISNLRRQVRHTLSVNGVKICVYVSDHEYTENGEHVTEDVKGMITPEYKLKRAMMWAIHGIKIREI